MAPANQQIVTAYEDCGMSPEDIAVDLGYSLEAVKLILLQHSQRFSDKALSKANELEEGVEPEVFTEADMNLAKTTIKTLCATAEVESVRFKAAEFIINERKGRNDIKALKAGNFNIVMVQQAMNKARAAISDHRERAKQVAMSRQVIELPA